MDLSEFLQSVATFSEFEPAELDVLERALRIDRFPANHIIFKEGQKGHSLYILMQGQVQVTRMRKDERGRHDLGVLGPGDLFGLQALIDSQPRYSTCRALTPVTAASLPRTAFNLLFAAHISLAEHFQYIVARQLVRELRRLNADAGKGHPDLSVSK